MNAKRKGNPILIYINIPKNKKNKIQKMKNENDN